MLISMWLQMLWIALGTGALLTLCSEFVQGLAVTGKVRAAAAIPQHRGAALLQLEIPKRCWTWFYLLGVSVNALLLLLVVVAQDTLMAQTVLRVLQSRSDTKSIAVNVHTVAFLSLFVLHLARRFYESLRVTQWGDSKMHIGGFALGCIHYLGVGVSALADHDATSQNQQDAPWRYAVVTAGVSLFVVASYHQSVCNALLAELKLRHALQHAVPRGDWFEYVRCPLYSAEVLLYAALALVAGGTNASLYAVLAWVVTNQSVSAQLNSTWYDRKFRDADLPRWKLVPHVW